MGERLTRWFAWLSMAGRVRTSHQPLDASHPLRLVRGQPLADRAGWLLILIAPAVVFFPILFRGYTLSQNLYGSDSSRRYGGVETIVQPDGQRVVVTAVRDTISGLQDEPWLIHLRRCLRAGWLPLIDLRSGAGTPLSELLQPGVFYPLNGLLPLLPEGPLLFDLFSLLHVWVLLIGLFVLFRRLEAGLFAAPLAILLAMSPITFLHVNMVHYRGQVWFPWILVGLDGVLRERRIGRSAVLLLLSSHFAVTAGNPQDALVSGGCAVLFLVGTVCSGVERPWRRLMLGGVLLCAGFGAGALAIAPYLFAVRDGALSSFGDATRSELALPFANWLALLVPGSQSWRLLSQAAYDVLPELSPTFGLLLILAVVSAAWSGRNRRWPLAAISAGVAVVWLTKLARPDWFPWIRELPVISSIRATKYQTQAFLMIAVAIAIVLGRWSMVETNKRRLSIVAAGGIVLAVTIGAFAWAFLYSPIGHWPDRITDAPLARWTAMQLCGCLFVAGLSALVLSSGRSPALTGRVLSVLMIAQGVLTFPAGLPQRRANYEVVNEIKALGPRVKEGRIATTWTTANTHLLFPDVAYLGTLSPINAKSAEEVLRGDLRPMEILGPWCLAHLTPAPLTADELGLMQLLGVRFLAGHTLDTDAAASIPHLRTAPPQEIIELPGALPATAYVLPKETFERYAGDARPASWERCWRDVSSSVAGTPQAAGIRGEANSVLVTTAAPVDGWLVLNAVYSPYWTINGERPVRFARHFPAWRLTLSPGQTATIRYWPRGLTIGIAISLASLGLVILMTFVGNRWIDIADQPPIEMAPASLTQPAPQSLAA